MNRRNFVGTLACAAASAAGAQTIFAQSSGLPFKLSIMASTLGPNVKPDVVEKLADIGYQGIELNGEYASWSEDEIRQFKQVTRTRGFTCDCIVDRPGPGGAGIVGAADPKAVGEAFPKKMNELITAAKKLEAVGIIVRAGARSLAYSRETQHDTCIDNLKRAADMVASDNITLLLENGDREENATGYLTSAAEGIEIVRRVGSPKVKMLYDLFHAQIEEGGLIKKLDKANIDLIGTVHFADNPGRHEPGTGEINYPNIVKTLVQNGFKGWVAMEYRPLKEPFESLREAREMVLKAARG